MSKSFFWRNVAAVCFAAAVFVVGCIEPVLGELTLTPPEWNFESVEQGQAKTQKIVITNTGSDPVTIERMEAPKFVSVKPALANTEIKPEGKAEIELTLASQEILGELQEYAYLILADSTIVPLTIKGKILPKAEPRLRVRPQTWDIGSLTVGESKQQVFECENAGTAELKIEKVRAYPPRFARIELTVFSNISKETLPAGEKDRFMVSAIGKSPGTYESEFYVKSNSAGETFTKITVKGYVVTKPIGVEVSDFSVITNKTPFPAVVTRTDKVGKTETITVKGNGRGVFAQEPGARPITARDCEGFTLTIKLAATPPPVTKPPEKEAAPEKPVTPSPGPEGKPEEKKPSEEAIVPPTLPPAQPEKAEPPKEGQQKEEKKPETPEEKKEPTAKPEEVKPSEGKSPAVAPPPSAQPEKSGPSGTVEKKEETKPEEPKGEKEAAPPSAPEKKESEKPAGTSAEKGEETKPSEGGAPPSNPQEKSSGSGQPAGNPPEGTPATGK